MNAHIEIRDKTEQADTIKITPFKKDTRKTTPHRHNNYLEIIYLSKGTGIHTIDLRHFEIQPPVVFIIRKEQIHWWNIVDEPEGYVLLIKKAFADTSADREIKQLIAHISKATLITVEDTRSIEPLLYLLEKEYQRKPLFNSVLLEGLLKALFATLLQWEKPLPLPKGNPTLVQQYHDLLTQSILRNNVAYYAQLLNTTPQNLNAACRRAENRPAAEILAGYITGEAKRLLLYTGLTVSEISDKLNFKDNSHFTKFFRRHTGTTPGRFRHSG